jgi:serine/threonine protein kinase/sugar lactone lactonase YvrE
VVAERIEASDLINAADWEQTKALFAHAIEIPAVERAAFMNSTGVDSIVAAEVLRLVAAHESASLGFLGQVTGAPGELFERAARLLADPLKDVAPSGSIIANRYELVRELGSGGGGVVYLAHDRLLHGRPVVLKFPLTAGGNDEPLLRRFEKEVKALARISHPGVVGALDVGQTAEGRVFLVMEYVAGDTLRSHLSSLLPLRMVAGVIDQIGFALNAAHSVGVLHRDLKPENVMIVTEKDGRQTVKLIDFGIAKVQVVGDEAESKTLTFAGTINYVAPEQLMGDAGITTDVFAFGVLVYEMLTGRRPFNPRTPFDLYEQQKRHQITPPSRFRSDLRRNVDRAVLRALSFDPKDRQASAAVFAREIVDGCSRRSSSISSTWRSAAWALSTLVLASALIYEAPQWRSLFDLTRQPQERIASVPSGLQSNLGHIYGVVSDSSGSIYFSAVARNQIYMFSPDMTGKPILIAGNGKTGFSGDGGDPLQAAFDNPIALAVNRNGDLLVVDQRNHRIRKISLREHLITTVAGTGHKGFSGDGGPPNSADLNTPAALAVDSQDRLFIADFGNNRVRSVAPGSGAVIETVAGSDLDGFSGDGGDPRQASFSGPSGLAVDQTGRLFISDQHNNRVRAVSFGLRPTIQTVAGTGQAAFGGDGGDPRLATMSGPNGLAVDRLGRLFITDSENHRIRRVMFGEKPLISTVAGSGLAGFSGDGGRASSARLSLPSAITIAPDGSLYIADYLNGRIRRVEINPVGNAAEH